MLILLGLLSLVVLNATTQKPLEKLSLSQALKILDKNNLELKVAKFESQMKDYEADEAFGYNLGKLDVSVTGLRSNDAGNVFGFKLQSREASFGDFGFNQFLSGMGQAMINPATGNPEFNSFAANMSNPVVQQQLLKTQPDDLNYPDARSHFQTKLTYMLPIYTGGKLHEYGKITKAMVKMSRFDTQKLRNEKIYQTRKLFCDISLVEDYIGNLTQIIHNIDTLENVVISMKIEGYAKNADLLEVEARKAEAQSMLNQAELNRVLAYQFLSFLLNTEVKSIICMKKMVPKPKIDLKALEASNIDIQKAKLGLEMTDMAVGVERSKFLPQVGAFAEYGSANDQLLKDFDEKDSYTVGVQLSWNLFSGGSDYANFEKAKVNRLKVQSQVALAKLGIALQVKKLETEIDGKTSDIKSYQKQLMFAQEVYRNYQARYQEGIVSISDVLIKQSKELEMLLKLLTVKNERNAKVFELESLLNQTNLSKSKEL